MAEDLPVRCRCGAVRGVVRGVSPATVNRALCYCHDCRAFAHWLERDDLLDARGGAELVQLARAHLEIAEGLDRVRCMRLSDKGLYRWYAECCRTPLGNTIPWIPFVGLARAAIDVPPERSEALFGPPLVTRPEDAVGGARPNDPRRLGRLAHVLWLLAKWSVRRLGHPTPFFDRRNQPTSPPRVLTAAERQALRDHPRA